MYPYGANLMSWKLKNGSEVLYARPGESHLELDGVRPLKCVRCTRALHSRALRSRSLVVRTAEVECPSTSRSLGRATTRRDPSQASRRCSCTASRAT